MKTEKDYKQVKKFKAKGEQSIDNINILSKHKITKEICPRDNAYDTKTHWEMVKCVCNSIEMCHVESSDQEVREKTQLGNVCSVKLYEEVIVRRHNATDQAFQK